MKKEIRYNRNKKNNPDTANVIGDGPPPNAARPIQHARPQMRAPPSCRTPLPLPKRSMLPQRARRRSPHQAPLLCACQSMSECEDLL